MTFLTSEPDLNGTYYSSEDLAGARHLLTGLLQEYYPQWLRNPVGQLAGYWHADSRLAAVYLIHIAELLAEMHPKMSPRSQHILIRKMLDLFQPVAKKVFEERLLELQVGAALADCVSPVIYEPGTVGIDAGRPSPKSPDFAVMLPEGAAVIEVTRVRLAFLDDWNAAASNVAQRLSKGVSKVEGLRRSVEFTAPISASRTDLEKLVSGPVLREVVQRSSGSVTVPVSLGHAKIVWSEQIDKYGINPALRASVLEVSYRATYESEEDEEERIVASIRSTLKYKRKKFSAPAPYLLATQIDEVNNEAVSDRLLSRIFPNNEHSWISGVLLFSPSVNWELGSPKHALKLHVNENARYPIPNTLRRIFNERIEFHILPLSRPK